MDARLKTSRYVCQTPEFLDARDGGRRTIVYSTRRREGRVLPSGAWQEVKRGRLDGLPERDIEDLRSAGILVPADRDEKREVVAEVARPGGKPRTLGITILPSATCQCECGYCGQEDSCRTMAPGDQDLVVKRIEEKLSSGSYRCLAVSWFGREPLTGLRVIESLTPRLREAAGRFGCAYRARAATNGLLLTEAVADRLAHHLGFRRLCVTLDGPPDVHDRRRPVRLGGSSFRRIFENLVVFARRHDSMDVRLIVRCNIDRTNRDRFPELLDLLKDAGIHRRVSIEVATVHDWENDAGKDSPGPEESAEWEIGALVAMFHRGFPIHLLLSGKRSACIALSPDSELVDPYGVLFECSERCLLKRDFRASLRPEEGQNPFDNRYAVGDLRSGVDRSKRRLLGSRGRLSAGEPAECVECHLLPICGGGCPKRWADGCQKPCPTMRYNLPQKLLLAHAIGRVKQAP